MLKYVGIFGEFLPWSKWNQTDDGVTHKAVFILGFDYGIGCLLQQLATSPPTIYPPSRRGTLISHFSSALGTDIQDA